MVKIIFEILNKLIYITLEKKNGSFYFRKEDFWNETDNFYYE